MVRREKHPIVERFLEQLDERGQRVTGTRKAVAVAVARQPGHFTIEGLSDGLPNVGRATVYRNVKLLVDLGLVCRVLLEDGHLHYQLSHLGHHHHLICTECGKSADLVGCELESMLQGKARENGFRMDGHWLEVYGHCQDCAAKSHEVAR